MYLRPPNAPLCPHTVRRTICSSIPCTSTFHSLCFTSKIYAYACLLEIAHQSTCCVGGRYLSRNTRHPNALLLCAVSLLPHTVHHFCSLSLSLSLSACLCHPASFSPPPPPRNLANVQEHTARDTGTGCVVHLFNTLLVGWLVCCIQTNMYGVCSTIKSHL